jgi:hypothetical protein
MIENKSSIQRKRNFGILGVIILVLVILILLVPISFIFSPTVTFIDTSLYKTSENRASVQTKTDFGDAKIMASFPFQVGKWQGSDYDVTEYIELLGANLMLLRGYITPGTMTEPIFFTIVQSKTESSFHAPRHCFTSQGYEIQEEGNENVSMSEASWLKDPSTATIPFNKLVITKSSKAGKLLERRVSLHSYVKGNQFYSDTISMIQTEAIAPLQGSYTGILNEQKDFLALAIPFMFAPGQAESQYQPLALIIASWGTGGLILLILLVMIPLSLMLFPHIGRLRRVPAQ